MKTAFKEFNCDMMIVNHTSRVLKLMSGWTSKYNLESQQVDKKNQDVSRKEISAKLKPDALRRDIVDTLALIDDQKVQS